MESEDYTQQELPKMSYYFISGNIPDEFGGLTKSLLLRSKLFGELKKASTHFLTFGFDAHFREKEEQFFQEDRIHLEQTKLVNLYETFLSDVSIGKRTYTEKIDLDSLISHKKKPVVFQKVGQLFGSALPEYELTAFNDSDRIQFVDYPTELKREEYRKDGSLATVSYYQSGTEHPYLVEFINSNYLVYLDKTFTLHPEKEEYVLSKINWYSDQGLLMFNREGEIRQHWIDTIQKASNERKLFLVDSRPQDRYIFGTKKDKNTYYAAIIHSKHYGENKFTIKQRFKELMSKRLLLDAVFFLTNEQLRDFQTLTGPDSSFFYTPHTLGKNLDPNVLNISRPFNKAVIVSRLTNSKNLKDSIHAFAKVVKSIPEATLDIYGSGEEEESLDSLIKELNLEQHITLKGYTNTPELIYQEATLTFCTSKFEGFGLSNLEALSNGCPVVTYDYDYGAQTLVQDGENGYIVKPGDIDALATKMIKIMNDENLRKSMAEQAFESANRFTPNAFINFWCESLNKMIEQADRKRTLMNEWNDKAFVLKKTIKDAKQIQFSIQLDSLVHGSEHITLVGLDRKFKNQIIKASLTQNNGELLVFSSHTDTQNIKPILPNELDVIDFYICINDSTGVMIHQRLKSDILTYEEFSWVKEMTIQPYETKFKNYSWRIN
ncbi:alpha-glucosyltransferase N-terminal domain-containing protein [Alkalihalobacillus sp. FSL W8-0930]